MLDSYWTAPRTLSYLATISARSCASLAAAPCSVSDAGGEREREGEGEGEGERGRRRRREREKEKERELLFLFKMFTLSLLGNSKRIQLYC